MALKLFIRQPYTESGPTEHAVVQGCLDVIAAQEAEFRKHAEYVHHPRTEGALARTARCIDATVQNRRREIEVIVSDEGCHVKLHAVVDDRRGEVALAARVEGGHWGADLALSIRKT